MKARIGISEIVLKSLGVERLQEFGNLANRCFTEKWAMSQLRWVICHRSYWGMAALSDGRLVGYLVGLLVQGEFDVISVAVDPEYRRLSIGRSLFESAMQAAAIERIVLEVDPDNGAAMALYKSLGFVRLGVRPRYYGGVRDAWNMAYDRERRIQDRR